VVFETPVIIVFLGLLGLVNTQMLKKGRRYFIVLAFLIGAFLSPPDVLSQIMMAGPLLVLFEVSILVLGSIEKRRKKEEESLEEWAVSTDLEDEEHGGESGK
jgi:sec-independent protein translocase protein TatC